VTGEARTARSWTPDGVALAVVRADPERGVVGHRGVSATGRSGADPAGEDQSHHRHHDADDPRDEQPGRRRLDLAVDLAAGAPADPVAGHRLRAERGQRADDDEQGAEQPEHEQEAARLEGDGRQSPSPNVRRQKPVTGSLPRVVCQSYS